MSAQKNGTVIGVDDVYHDIRIGDIIEDEAGQKYTIDKYGRAKPLGGGNEQPLSSIKKPFVIESWQPNKKSEQEKPEVLPGADIEKLSDFNDKDLANELRRRGYKVTATKLIKL